MSEPWRITLLGSLRAQQGERIISRFKTQKVASLFAYLAYHLRQAHSREILIEMLWPESDAPTLRNSLSVALSTLRNQFEPPGVPQGTVIRADRFSVGLNSATVTTDVAEFEQAVKAAAKAMGSLERAQRLTDAVELYQGSLLPGFYEDWIPAERERLSGLFFDSVSTLVNHLESIGDTRTALLHARHAVAVEPLREEGQLQLIRLLHADGQSAGALRQYTEFARLLKEESGEEPSATLRSVFRQIEQASGMKAPTGPSASRQPRTAPATAAPSGPATMTFLMTDIEGSTRAFQEAPDAYTAARKRHHALLRSEFSRHGGQEVQDSGDGFIVAFPTVGNALACAVEAQQALAGEAWPKGLDALKVRMALHTGDVQSEHGQYHGIVLHHGSRLLSAAHGGQILVSEASACLLPPGGVGEIWLTDLGVHRLRDIPEGKRIFQAEYPDMPRREFGPLAAESGYKANVPPRFTRFFGREREITQLVEMLGSPEIRLVTVTGPGGNGKTRLSLEVAERLADSFSGAVYFVPLQDLTEPGMIPGAILDGLSISRSANQDLLEQVVARLSDKASLLVLDNFEHLVEGGALVVEALLARAPGLKVLSTSRQLLALPAEHAFQLAPLKVPDLDGSPEELSLYDSVQLFIDRAQQVVPYFQVNNSNAAAVASLVGGLEGIPLAIELAAARVQVLTPQQMLSQLSRRLDFLASRKRGVSERQRTLRGALDWSYHLLAPELQRFFYRLSVFRGGWDEEAAIKVCEEPLALDYLEQLRECSLISAGETSTMRVRFWMLETLREYGLERLEESKEAEAVRDRHLSYFLAVAWEGHSHLWGSEAGAWLDRFEVDHDNLLAALTRCQMRTTSDAVEQELRLVVSLGRFWDTRGYVREGRERLTRALARCEGRTVSADVHANALVGAGWAALLQGDWNSAIASFTRSREAYVKLRNKKAAARNLMLLGVVARNMGDFDQAEDLYKRSLAEFKLAGDDTNFGVLGNLGELAIARGNYEHARDLLKESLPFYRERNSAETGLVLYNLGKVMMRLGDHGAAWDHFTESLGLVRATGVGGDISKVLDGMAELAAEQSRPLRVARLVGARQSLYESADFGEMVKSSSTVESFARGALTEEVFSAALADGRAMSREQAIEYALSGAE